MVVKNKTIDTSSLNSLIKKTEKNLTKQKPQEDYLRRILVNKLIYDGEDSLDQSEIKYLHDTKPRENKAAKKPYTTYRRGDAKIIVDELKRQKRKTNPILKSKPIKIDPTPLLPAASEDDPQLKVLEARFNEIVKEDNIKKTSGLAGLLGVRTDKI